MACQELERLRERATALKQKLDDQRRKARATAGSQRARGSGKSELVPFLQRKLQRMSEKIELHKAGHHCQD
jgi:hypothetical protein